MLTLLASCGDVVVSLCQLKSAFGDGKSMWGLNHTLVEYAAAFEDIDVLGNFVDCHDVRVQHFCTQHCAALQSGCSSTQ